MTQIGRSSRRHDVVLPDGSKLRLAWLGASDRGHRRAANEDSVLARVPIFAVADGMGGHKAGGFASSAVVKRLAAVAAEGGFVEPEQLVTALRLAVGDMSEGVGDEDPGTGTTITGVALTVQGGAPYWLVFNIGDSRVYLAQEGGLVQLTRDHSLVQQMVEAGEITAEQAETHPHSNVITRAVGYSEDPVPDFALLPVTPGDRILVCSDGLTKELTAHGLLYFLSQGADPAAAARRLLDAALGNGGRDNVSVIVIEVVGLVGSARPPQAAPA